MTIKLSNGNKILNRDKIDKVLKNFYDKMGEVENNIKKLEDEIEKARNEKRELMYKSMLEAGNKYSTPIANVTAKIENFESMLTTENETLISYRELLQNPEIEQLLNEFFLQSFKDLEEFQDVEEKAIYDELAEIRDRQLELFDKLTEKRNAVEKEVRDFTEIAEKLGYPQFKKTVGFHDNPNAPHPRFKELKAIMFECKSIRGAREEYDWSKRRYV